MRDKGSTHHCCVFLAQLNLQRRQTGIHQRQYSGTPLKGHPWNEDTSPIRTLAQVPTSYKYVLFASWNEDTPLIRTHFKGVHIRGVPLYAPIAPTEKSPSIPPPSPPTNHIQASCMLSIHSCSELTCMAATAKLLIHSITRIVHASLVENVNMTTCLLSSAVRYDFTQVRVHSVTGWWTKSCWLTMNHTSGWKTFRWLQYMATVQGNPRLEYAGWLPGGNISSLIYTQVFCPRLEYAGCSPGHISSLIYTQTFWPRLNMLVAHQDTVAASSTPRLSGPDWICWLLTRTQ